MLRRSLARQSSATVWTRLNSRVLLPLAECARLPPMSLCAMSLSAATNCISYNLAIEGWLDPSSIGRDGMAQRCLAVLQEGQVCGELALLDGGLRSAQLKAGPTGVKLLVFKRRDLLKLCSSDTTIGYRVMFNLACALALRMRLQDMRLYPEG